MRTHMKFELFSKISKSTFEKSHFCPDKTCFAAQNLLIVFQNHIINMISNIKTQFSLETFHPETKKNILQKSKFSKIIFLYKNFQTFFHSQRLPPIFEILKSGRRVLQGWGWRPKLRPRLWLRLMLRVTQATPKPSRKLRQSLEAWALSLGLETWSLRLQTWALRLNGGLSSRLRLQL